MLNKMIMVQQDDFCDVWVKKYGGVQGNCCILLVFIEGLEVYELIMLVVDQQLLEFWQWQVIDVVCVFGVFLYMIGEIIKVISWGSGIESMGIGFVKFMLGLYLKCIKDELNCKLF